MTSNQNFERSKELIKSGQWNDAIPFLQKTLTTEPNNSNAWYLLGQCHRFTNQIELAIDFYENAINLDSSQPSYFLALGIANQLIHKYEESLSALRLATTLDADYVEAFNSAALTLKRMNNFTKSVEIFDAAADALARQFIKNYPNTREALICEYRHVKGNLWIDYSINAVLYDAARENIGGISLPSSESAKFEYLNRSHGGLYWEDILSNDGKSNRTIFPNFLDSIREYFISDKRYCSIIGNKGMVLDALDDKDAARLHFNEAEEFQELYGK